MDIQNLTASILLADLKRRGFFKQPGSVNDIIAASKLVAEILYEDEINRGAGGEPGLLEPSLVTIMDPPDVWGVRHNMGLAELAARLGSIDTFDKRGEVLWMDNFDSGIEGWVADGDPGFDFLWVPEFHRSGGFCAELLTKAQADAEINIVASFAYPKLSSLGFEFSFLKDPNTKTISSIILLYEGADVISGGVNWTAATQTLSVGGNNLTPTINFEVGYPTWNTIKLVCDFVNEKYVRLVVNNIAYDLSSYALTRAPGEASPHIELYVDVVALSAYSEGFSGARMYIDDAIYTQNEP